MPATPRPPELLTVVEVAERLRVSYGTVYTLLREGDLPAVKVGSQWRVESTKLDAFISRGSDETPTGEVG